MQNSQKADGERLAKTSASIFRQYIAPFLIVLVFLVALAATSARIFLPSDMMAPAPVEEQVIPGNEGTNG